MFFCPLNEMNKQSLIVLMVFSLILCVISQNSIAGAHSPSDSKVDSVTNVPNPGTDLWREIVQQQPRDLLKPSNQFEPQTMTSRVQQQDSTVLVSNFGQLWREVRMDRIIPYSAMALGGMLCLLFLFYVLRGQIKIRAGRSPEKIKRYSLYERILHWSLASCFLLLGLTGMVLLFGRSIIIPVFGKEANSQLALIAKTIHDYVGPVFIVFLVLMFLKFVIRNIYARGDMTWLLRGGGIIGDKHVPSGFFNMGEKTMFWSLIIIGGLISVSGLVLDFPNLHIMREYMELSHLVHAICGMLMFTLILAHIYIGSIGMEGALEGMKSGYCDRNWAMEHHENWAEECEREKKVVKGSEI